MLPFVMLSSSCFMDFWIIYRSSKQNIFIDFIIRGCLLCENKKGIKLGFSCVPLCCVLLYLAVRLCASDLGYSFLFVTDEQFSEYRDNPANTKPVLRRDPPPKRRKSRNKRRTTANNTMSIDGNCLSV